PALTAAPPAAEVPPVAPAIAATPSTTPPIAEAPPTTPPPQVSSTPAAQGPPTGAEPPKKDAPATTFSGRTLDDPKTRITQTAALPPGVTLSPEPPPVLQEAKVTRRVNPDYPSDARRKHIEGSVDVSLKVSKAGAVSDVAVVRSDPPGTFDRA